MDWGLRVRVTQQIRASRARKRAGFSCDVDLVWHSTLVTSVEA